MARLSPARLKTNAAAFGKYVLRRFKEDNGLRVAASLSYTSLLSLVPLLTIGFAMLAAFPGFAEARQEILTFLLDNLVMQDEEQVRGYFDTFLANAGQMGAIGLVGLGVTALLLLSTIETAMNGVFRVRRQRPPLVRLLVYWALLTLGPVLVGASFTLSGYITHLTRVAGVEEAFTGTTGALTQAAPTLLIAVAFALFYVAMPNRPVKWRHAVVGALVAGMMFAVLRWGFSLYVVAFPSYKAIYGAISSIPIFLIWMYLSWAVVLFGASLTASIAEWSGTRGPLAGAGLHTRRLWLAVHLLALLDAEARAGGGPVSRRVLLRRTGAGESDLDGLLDHLEERKFIARTDTEKWVLARSPDSTTLTDLFAALDMSLSIAEDAPSPRVPWAGRLRTRLEAAETVRSEALSAPLSEVFTGAVTLHPDVGEGSSSGDRAAQ